MHPTICRLGVPCNDYEKMVKNKQNRKKNTKNSHQIRITAAAVAAWNRDHSFTISRFTNLTLHDQNTNDYRPNWLIDID